MCRPVFHTTAKTGHLGCLWPLSVELFTSAAKGIHPKCCVLHTVLNFTSPPPSYRPMEKNCAKLSVRHPWHALAVPGVLSKGWEATSPSQNWEVKNGKKKASKYHEIFTMGVINTVLNINEQLECSPLVLQLKWRRLPWSKPRSVSQHCCQGACCLIPPQKTSSLLMVQK